MTPDTAANDPVRLAMDGGQQSFFEEFLPRPGLRWGDAETELLRETLQQRSLFYYKNGATSRMLDRFREQYPLEYVMPCTSGTAAIHIALAAAGLRKLQI